MSGSGHSPSSSRPLDRLGRALADLRVSVTDRCNLRCRYCMPREAFADGHAFLPRAEILSFEEIYRVVRIFVGLGVRKVRLTGGEPLLRAALPELVRMLSRIDGLELALTTNGTLLSKRARALANAGLGRVTVSLDALDQQIFEAMTDSRGRVEQVLAGIAEAEAAGLGPVKVNMVVRAGMNDTEIEPMARHFKGTGRVLRFIEYMDVGTTNRWQSDEVLGAEAILERVGRVGPLEPIDRDRPEEVAERWRYVDGGGEIGVIASVTRPFCRFCSRARLSARGELFTCLFASRGTDLRALLREGASDDALAEAIGRVWQAREDRYSELRASGAEGLVQLGKAEMSYLGG